MIKKTYNYLKNILEQKIYGWILIINSIDNSMGILNERINDISEGIVNIGSQDYQQIYDMKKVRQQLNSTHRVFYLSNKLMSIRE